MPKYIICPRCDLNYILENEQYCDVCKADLKLGPKLMFSVQEDDDENKALCPICKTHYIESEEYNACEYCRSNGLRDTESEPDVIDDENDESWRQYLDDDEKAEISNRGDEEESLLLSQIEEEESLKDEMFDDEEEYEEEYVSEKDDEDFNYDVNEADFEDYDDEDEEDEEGDDDDDDEDETPRKRK